MSRLIQGGPLRRPSRGCEAALVLRTPLCEKHEIDDPILAAPFGSWEQVELAAADSNAASRREP